MGVRDAIFQGQHRRGQPSGGIRGVAPSGQHNGGIRGVAPSGQHSGRHAARNADRPGESDPADAATPADASGAAGATGETDISAGRRRIGLLLAVAVVVLAGDIISKIAVVATLSDRPPVRLLGGFLKLTVSRNSGAAFSFMPTMTVLFTAIAVSVIVFILRTSRRIRSVPWAITLGLLLGGATGNLTDRLLRSPGPFRGDVVDWIQVPHWPIFNLADSSIVCGGILAVLLAMRGIRIDGVTRAQASGSGRRSGGTDEERGQPQGGGG